MIKYNLGCGFDKKIGFINIDSDKDISPDLVRDLNKDWTKGLEKADLILAYHLLEHLDNPIKFFKQCEDLLKPNGELLIKVPCVFNTNGFEDPTHKNYFTPETFKHYLSNTFNHYNTDKGIKLKLVYTRLGFQNKFIFIKHILTRILFNYSMSLSYVKEIEVSITK